MERVNIYNSKSNKGFTIVELMVVIVVMTIVLGLSAYGILAWQDFAEFNKQNEYAQIIFTDAQIQLTEYSVNGKLDSIRDRLKKETGYTNVVNVANIIASDGNNLTLENVFSESKGKSEQEKYQETICYIKCDKGDYANYRDGVTVSKGAQIIFELLEPYIYDTSILNNSICIEFTPENAQIFSVCFSDKVDSFEYNQNNAAIDGTVNISNRTESYRKERKIGYYGVDTLSVATSSEVYKPSITNVKLNNEETLNLTFKLGKITHAVRMLTYEISIYDKETTKKVLSITIDGKNIKNEENKEKLDGKVSAFKYKTGSYDIKDMGTYKVWAWIEADGTVKVILDAADLKATTNKYETLLQEIESNGIGTALDNTNSFHRFSVNADNIYCIVQGNSNSESKYKPTSPKQSNTSSVYFANTKISGDKETDRITNARHLYNLRYVEDVDLAGDSRKRTFELTENIDWKQFALDKHLYDGNEFTNKADSGEFIPFKRLKMDDIFNGNNHYVSGIKISFEECQDAGLYENHAGRSLGNEPVGMFITNFGVIKDVTLDNIVVTGRDKVGAFCGENVGTLTNLKVKSTDSTSSISGISNVGGIIGYQASSGNVTLQGLDNYASVSGSKYVGGIVGKVVASDGSVLSVNIDNCNNYGSLDAVSNNDVKAMYVGGIVGLASNESTDVTKLVISGCNSIPAYSKESIEQIFANKNTVKDRLVGVYVGGIVGYNKNGTIERSNTVATENRKGYVFGEDFVGGIVGFSEGGIVGKDTNNVNEANVIGKNYVGGIIGCNANVGSVDANGVITPERTRNEALRIANWINKGVVIAYGNYAGGITGYNVGTIVECDSNINKAESGLFVDDITYGDYAGGIVGYNNGVIASTAGKNVVCYVSGNNYVGGVVGFNDIDAVVDNYQLSGGYIKATGCFAGGFVGLNTSINLLMKENGEPRVVRSRPNEVEGRYFVGGNIGANIVKTSGDIKTIFETDNFLGKVNASAFAGGFIGYNILTADSDEQAIAQNLLDKVALTDKLEDTIAILDNLDTTLGRSINRSSNVFYIEGKNGKRVESTLGRISGDIYIGGVIGYNDEDTYLHVKNVVNNTPVEAKSVVNNKNEQTQLVDCTGKYYSYSYSGGILGKVGRRVTLYNCENSDVGDIVTNGTYTGGLCEINEGTIEQCKVSNIGSAKSNYVGGICGINKENALIKNCYVQGKHITGKSIVAGIAAENYGNVEFVNEQKDSEYTNYINGCIVNTTGSVAAGIVAYNYSTGEIRIDGDISDINITAAGSDAGAIIGVNEGKLVNTRLDDAKVTVSGNIVGNENIGGIIGTHNSDDEVKGIQNRTVVIAYSGNAGGIIGANNKNANIKNCVNTAVISTTKKGNAGGITAENKGRIEDCYNHGEVKAPNGSCGGIVATNKNTGYIKNCHVLPEDVNGTLTMTSLKYVGGIASENDGTIEYCDTKKLTIINNMKTVSANMGSMAGVNNGLISLAGTECVVGCIVKTISDYSNIGGVAGVNNGTIKGISWYRNDSYTTPTTKINCTIEYASSNATIGNMGGVAGHNTGNISNIAVVNSTVTANLGTDTTGAGGIAGVSEKGREEAKITNCTFDGTVYGVGRTANVVRIGGTVGLNKSGSTVEGCRIAVFQDTVISGANNNSSFAYTGGIVGQNYGKVLSCDNYHESNNYKAMLTIYSGYIGGIVGRNEGDGLVSGTNERWISSGKKWEVLEKVCNNDGGNAGVIGFTDSGENISYCKNYASVKGESTSNLDVIAGVIGRDANTAKTGQRITYCYNYGTITGSGRTGGVMGLAKYYGINFEHCANYGRIEKSNHCGGILGAILATSEGQQFLFNDCANYGYIKGAGNVAGILGSGADSVNSKGTLIFYNCLNYGYINASKSGGIMSGCTDSNILKFELCRNYGTCNYGISYNNLNEMRKCFSVNNASNGLGKLRTNGIDLNNFYIKKDSLNFNEATNPTNSVGIKMRVVKNADNTYMASTKYIPDYAIANLKYNPCANEYHSDNKDYTESTVRFPTYKEIDSKYLEFIQKIYSDKALSKPTNIKYSLDSGYYIFTWDEVEGAYSYEIECEFINKDGTKKVVKEMVYGNQYSLLTIPADYDGEELNFKVRAVSGYEMINKDKKLSSDFATLKIKLVLEKLPTPKIHIEYIEGKTFIAVLDNQSDFIRDGKYIDCTIEVSLSKGTTIAQTYTIEPEIGYSTEYKSKAIGTLEHYMSIAQAVPKIEGTFLPSEKPVTETCIIGTSDIQSRGASKSLFNVTFKGFYGDTIDSLKYSVDYSVGGDKDYYLASDLMGYNEELNAFISYGHADSHITSTIGTVTSDMKNITEDMFCNKDITVMSYPWTIQGHIIYYGHTVATKLSLEEVKNLVDNTVYSISGTTVNRKSESIWNNGNLKAGYIISINDEGSYDVYYSDPVARSTDKKPYNVIKKVYTYSDGKYVSDTETIECLKAPVIDTDKTDVFNETDNTYSFTWDSNTEDTTGKYYVKLEGITLDNNKVLLYAVDDVMEKGYIFVDNEAKWNYPKLVLTVTRKGDTDSTGKTLTFPATSVSDPPFTIKLRLSTITKPTLEFSKNEDGTINKDELKYVISFEAITDENELKDLAGYLITVQALETEGIATPTKTHNFYVKVAEDITNIPDVIDCTKDAIIKGNVCTTTIDLSEYNGKEKVEVSVKAIAIKDSQIYRDGAKGVERSMTIPERNKVPDVTKLKSNIAYDENSYVAEEALYTNGINLIYQTEDSGNQGNYQIAAAVCEDSLSDSVNKVYNIGDSENSDNTGYWNDGSLETYYYKRDKKDMDGTFANGVLTIKNILADFAGRYLKVVMRSVSDSNISSFWSDEDNTSENTINYSYIRIPRAKLRTPILSEEIVSMYYINGNWYDDETGISAALHTQKEQLRIEKSKYADGYKIVMAGKEPDSVVAVVYLVKNDEGYEVYSLTTANEICDANSKCIFDDNAVLIGTVDNSTKVQIDYYGEFKQSEMDVNMSKSYAYVKTDEDNIYLTLPDIIDNEYIAKYTSLVTVEALISEDNKEFYENSDKSVWHQNEEGSGTNSTSVTEAPINVEIEDLSTIYGYEYKITSPDRFIMQVKVVDKDDNTIYLAYKNVMTDDKTGVFRIASPYYVNDNWVSKVQLLEKYEGYKVYVRFTGIYGDSGIGQWSEYRELLIKDFSDALPATPGNASPGNASPGDALRKLAAYGITLFGSITGRGTY